MKINYPNMIFKEADEASASERYLIRKCQSTFLSLWSYHNLFTTQKKGKELCDVLALFGNHIFIFSDKLCGFDNDGDIRIAWNRWYRHAVEAGAKQILGAERYIRSNGSIFLDSKLTCPFPLPLTINKSTHIHRIIVARGVRDACRRYFDGGNGSLVVNTQIVGKQHLYDIGRDGIPIASDEKPIFSIGIVADRQHYIHVFDDYTLDCIMDELDTVSDFISYLEQKERLIGAGKDILAAGEEELLGRYLSITENEQHCIIKENEFQKQQGFRLSGFWEHYLQAPERLVKIDENRVSYLWDDLLEKAFKNMREGTLRSVSHQDYQSQVRLFYRFAKPCRVERRVLANAFRDSYAAALEKIDIHSTIMQSFIRYIRLDGSEDTLITILWLYCPSNLSTENFLAFRKRCLEAKILSKLPTCRECVYHVGIAKTLNIEREDSEDFIYINSNDFQDECDEIREAQDFLDTQSTFLGRRAAAVHAEEYNSSITITEIPFSEYR